MVCCWNELNNGIFQKVFCRPISAKNAPLFKYKLIVHNWIESLETSATREYSSIFLGTKIRNTIESEKKRTELFSFSLCLVLYCCNCYQANNRSMVINHLGVQFKRCQSHFTVAPNSLFLYLTSAIQLQTHRYICNGMHICEISHSLVLGTQYTHSGRCCKPLNVVQDIWIHPGRGSERAYEKYKNSHRTVKSKTIQSARTNVYWKLCVGCTKWIGFMSKSFHNCFRR